jgi:nicotinate-nucleotide pyrophosphorylase (carboxylating)
MTLGTTSTLEEIVARALAEDVGRGDLTSEGLFPPDERCDAELLVKQAGVVCGIRAAEAVFRALDPDVEVDVLLEDGTQVAGAPAVVARVGGRARAVLTAERTALNLLGRLSGIATLTRRYVDAVEGTGAVVLDTRKTTPGMRELEKEAVRCGGGTNHRLGLFDAILVKDNHLRLAGGIAPAVDRLRGTAPAMPIEVEVESLDQLDEALAAGVDRILLDNMPPAVLREAVRRRDARAVTVPLEASGGITLETVRAVAETGVDFVSVGALTHSAGSLDVSMEVLS